MTGIFPSMTAVGGARGLLNRGKGLKAARALPQDKPLGELMSGNARMVDTYAYEYVNEVVRNTNPFAVADRRQHVRIAVIGAGVAGVTAAYELSRAFRQADLDPADHIHIFEGNRPGGRLHSLSFTDARGREYFNEMGAMRVPDNSKLFWNYFAKLGQDPRNIQKIFPNPGVVATELYFRGQKFSWIGDQTPTPADPAGSDLDWSKIIRDVGEFVGSLTFAGMGVGEIYALLTKNDTLSGEDQRKIQAYWSHFLKEFDSIPFISALSRFVTEDVSDGKPWGPTEFNMFSTLGFGTGGFGPLFPVCFLEIFRLFLWDYASEYSPDIAMDQIVTRFLNLIYANDPLADKAPEELLRMNTVVHVALDEASDKPVVFYVNDHQEIAFEQFDYVIAATTLRSMQVSQNLDAEVVPSRFQQVYGERRLVPVFAGERNNMVREAMRIPHIMNSSKLFGFVEHKPWTDPRWQARWGSVAYEGQQHPVKCVLTDTLARQMYFLDPYVDDPGAGSNVLISYNWGDDSIKIMGVLDFNESQTITPDSNPDYNLKTSYVLGLDSAVQNSVVAEVIDTGIELRSPDRQETNLQSIVWQQVPLMFGAFKLDYPEQFYYTTQMVYQYHYANCPQGERRRSGRSDRVFVANNNCSFQGGWIEGAMQSAVNASAAVLKSMAGRGEAVQFRMESLFKDNPFSNVIREMAPRYECGPLRDR